MQYTSFAENQTSENVNMAQNSKDSAGSTKNLFLPAIEIENKIFLTFIGF